ncbi:MAG: SpoIIE family protein phosphatase [Acidimicrobiia bacterium]|nr:SpoIIE family protein phosphatase [Acidimicrobiia bacterium]
MDPVPVPDNDPLATYLVGAGGPVDVDKIELDSPAVDALRAAEVAMIVPLISQGELIGTLSLGRRMSDQPYSSDDRKLLRGLAAQVAPAIRLAQMVRKQEAEAKHRERMEQELRVAALIQQTLLPKELPALPGWEVDAYYRPAREVGGDFYDFIPLDERRLALVIGDVTDKGVPAALVMATTRSTLRAAAQRHDDPGEILAETNEVLVAEVPPGMFVTCLFAVLDHVTGQLTFANAGHNLPYVRTEDGVIELRATGMPLGLMPGMQYEVRSTELPRDAVMLLTSDGIVEAHGVDGSMFGFDRLMGLVGGSGSAGALTSKVLAELDRFCGPAHEPEDDVTMVSIRRLGDAAESAATLGRHQLDRFDVASEEGNERIAMERVTDVVRLAGLAESKVEQLRTAVAEAVMNAIEHGNGFGSEVPVEVAVFEEPEAVVVQVADIGVGPNIENAETPDLDAKLAGTQSPRGWGLFLIEQMVDEVRQEQVNGRHVVELEMMLEGDQ